MLPEYIIFVAILFNLIGCVFYVKSVIKGDTKPNLASWIPWVLAPFIAVFFQLEAGAGLSVLPVLMAGLGSLTIVITAALTKNALWKLRTFDIFCLSFSIIAIALYVLTHNLEISIIFAILSDGLAYVPSYVKTWKFPKTESSAAYSWPIIANIIGLLVIKEWSFTIYSFGMYLIVCDIAMITIIYRKKIFKTA